jgi:pimeloyl-ACP methyl ester carboxylesterase
MTTAGETFEQVAGCRIRIMRKGAGEPLLFLHGASGAGRWLPFMETLSQQHDVIVPEHPGFGQSDTPEWLDNIADLAHFYQDLIDQLGLRKVHLVGTSLGGWIAAELARFSCEKLQSLTLVAAAGVSVPGVRKGDMFMWSPEEMTQKLFHDQQLAQAMPQPSTEDEVMVGLKNRLMTAKLSWSPRLHNPHLRKWLHRITAPTLIIWGDDDQLLPLAYGQAYEKLIPGAQLQVISACGHLPHVEKPQEFTAKVLDFTRRSAQ